MNTTRARAALDAAATATDRTRDRLAARKTCARVNGTCTVLRMTHTNIEARKAALFARTSTPALLASVEVLDGIARPTEEQRMVRAWTLGELSRRVPGLDEAVDAWLDSDEGLGDESVAHAHVRIARELLAS